MELKENGKATTSEKIEEILNKSKLPYIPITHYNHDGFFVPIEDIKNEQLCDGIRVIMCNKDCCRIFPHEILYITIEDRKSVLYLTNGRVETNYHLDHWKKLLDEKYFAQPHYSFIVNLNYVVEVSKKSVKIKNGSKEYSVYTSSRRIGDFKKLFLNFRG